MHKFYTLLSALMLLSGTIGQAQTPTHLVGGDLSLLPSYEQYNTPYYNPEGQRIDDVLLYLRDVEHWNAIRVRLFVNPTELKPSEKTGVVQDLPYVTALGQRIKEAGMKFMLDFHYSDSWADPTHQKLPASWSDCNTPQKKADKVYQYTCDCLNTLNEAKLVRNNCRRCSSR